MILVIFDFLNGATGGSAKLQQSMFFVVLTKRNKMNPEETIEFNKRCAEFLGFEEPIALGYKAELLDEPRFVSNIKGSFGHFALSELKFHSDWNWIMEVKEKICSLNLSPSMSRVYFNTFSCRKDHQNQNTYKVIIHFDSKNNIEFKCDSNNEKEAVVSAINQFLIWYNEYNKK